MTIQRTAQLKPNAIARLGARLPSGTTTTRACARFAAGIALWLEFDGRLRENVGLGKAGAREAGFVYLGRVEYSRVCKLPSPPLVGLLCFRPRYSTGRSIIYSPSS